MRRSREPSQKNLNVFLTGNQTESKRTEGQVTVQFWDQKDRFRRAGITWALCWGGAIVSIFFPLVHFFLVPALLIAGPIAASIIYGQRDVILGGSGICPYCGKPFKIVRSKLQWPVTDLCTACQHEAKIVPQDPLPDAPERATP